MRPFRLLVVEDNPLIRDMFEYGLRKYFRGRSSAVEVEHAEDGSAAWRMVREAPYDLAIIDYFLPGLDGASLVARIRKETRIAALPIVAISIGGAEARDATIAAGANLFLDKPLVLRDLFSMLERMTRGRA